MQRIILFSCTVGILFGSLFPSAWAQDLEIPLELDIAAPIIQHNPFSRVAPAGKRLVIDAVLMDNDTIHEATLFYRTLGETKYSSVTMNSIGNNRFTATIPKESVLEPAVEYYLQVTDPAGNTAFRGFTTSPLAVTVRVISEKEDPSSPEPDETANEGQVEKSIVSPMTSDITAGTAKPAIKPWYKKWWVWTIAGAVVIGAASAGGGGDSSNGGGNVGGTGSATITGPIP